MSETIHAPLSSARHARVLLTLAVWLVAIGGANAAPPTRSGFTLELGIGFGAIEAVGLESYGDEKADTGFEPHALSLGSFLTNDLALEYRWKSTYHSTVNSAGGSAHRFVGTHTLHAQWWFADRWFFGTGVGLAIFGHGFGRARSDAAWAFGFGATTRFGWGVFEVEHHAITVSLEFVVGVFGEGTALGQTVTIGWQYY